jgi:[ribosomal protein S18]-alanine N-acetyltransferase
MISLLRITSGNHRNHLERILEIEALSFLSPWSAGGFIQEIRNPMASFWAALSNGKAVGFICYWVLDFEIHLLNFAVHPKERRKGTGRLLLDHMVEEAFSRGLESVWLEVRVSNSGAVKLYRDFGFEQVGVRPKYYDDTREDALIMRLAFLDPSPSLKNHAYGGR